MSEQKNDKWLDEIIGKTINTEKPQFDAEKFKQKFPEEFQILQSRAKKQTANISRWTNIFKSPITKLAAAAVVIMAVTFGIFNLDFNTRVYGITDVPEIIRQAETIHIKEHYSGFVANTDPGFPNRVNIYRERWIDYKNGKYYNETSQPFPETTDANEIVMKYFKRINVFDGQYIMHIDQRTQSAEFEKLSEFQGILSVRRLHYSFLEGMSPDILTGRGFTQSGSEQINGEDYNIWERVENGVERSQKHQYWVSPSSGKLRKSQRLEKSPRTNQQWSVFVETDIEINQIPPEDIFKTEVPEGYSASNTKESVIIQELESKTVGVYIEDQYVALGEIDIMMALPDGTLVMAWNSNYDYVVELLEQFNLGDKLPEIPLKITYESLPEQNPENISYSVRHLAGTQKDGVFHEWYIYVPDKDMSGINHYLSSRFLLNAALPATVEVGPYTIPYFYSLDVLIHEEEDFDTFVLGAMAQLSDDGQAPEGVTYEKVLRLAQQIRESSAK